MAILDNLENAWDLEPKQNLNWCHSGPMEFESNPIVETDAMGRETFWEDIGRPENDGLALKLFSETVCTNCSCKNV